MPLVLAGPSPTHPGIRSLFTRPMLIFPGHLRHLRFIREDLPTAGDGFLANITH